METIQQRHSTTSIDIEIISSNEIFEPVPVIAISTSSEVIDQSEEMDLEYNIDFESRLKQATTDRDEAVENQNNLFKILERSSMEIDRLEADSKVLRQQMQDSVNAKCESDRKFEEIQYKVIEAEFKEKRFIHAKNLAQNQIEMLKNDLSRNIQEHQRYRMESTKRIALLEGQLREKSSELKLSTENEAQLKELNEMLATKVEELSEEILKINEDFSVSMKMYQQELSSKSKLIELFKQKSEDGVDAQKEVTEAVSEMATSLKEAADEYEKLETKFNQNDIQHKIDIEELTKLIETLKQELQTANQLHQAAKMENLEFLATYDSSLSIIKVYSMYVNAKEDFIILNSEHEKLKETLATVVHEIEEKAIEFQNIQFEYKNLREAYQTLSSEYEAVKDKKIQILLNDVSNLSQNCMDLEMENEDLSIQVLELQHVIEDKAVKQESFGDNVEELQDNNEKLVGLVQELAAVIQQVDGPKEESATKMVQKCKDLKKMLTDEQKKFEDFKEQSNLTIEKLEDQVLQLHNELSLANEENDRKLKETEEFSKLLLDQAQNIIAELTKENQEIKNHKEKVNDSIQSDFISCVGSSTNLEAFVSASDLVDPQNEAEPKLSTQKRQRDEDDDDESEYEDAFAETFAEKRAKIEKVKRSLEKIMDDEAELELQIEEFQAIYCDENSIKIEEIEKQFEDYEIIYQEDEDTDSQNSSIEGIIEEFFGDNCDYITID